MSSGGDAFDDPVSNAFNKCESGNIYNFGIWFMAISQNQAKILLSTGNLSHIVEIAFASNGWFKTCGPKGCHAHWSSGRVTDDTILEDRTFVFLRDCMGSGRQNPLRPGCGFIQKNWKISLDQNGVLLSYQNVDNIFLSIAEPKGVFRGAPLSF